MPTPSNEALTEEAWQEWLQHPATKALRAWAKEQQEALKEMWAAGSFAASFEVEMLVKNSAATGACSIYKLVEEMEHSLIIEGREDGKS